jgi:hypothetical protein
MKTTTQFKQHSPQSRLCLTSLAVTALFWLLSLPAQADTYWQLPVVVNVVKGDPTTDAQIDAMVAEVNRTLAQCGNISITVVKKNHGVPDPQHPRGGDAEGEVRPDERDTLRKNGQKECATNNAGGKFTVAKGLRDTNGTAMVTVNGVAVIGHPVSILNDGQADGRTWAHEFCHTLGLDHNAIPGNLMESPRPPGAGTALTPEQCADILKAMIAKGAKSAKTIEQQLEELWEWFRSWMFDEDTSGLTIPPHLDLDVITHSFQVRGFGVPDQVMAVVVSLELKGLCLPGPVYPEYLVAYDTDANPLTGVPIGEFQGVERALMLQVTPLDPFQPPEVSAHLMDLMSGQMMPVPARAVRRNTSYESTVPWPDEPLQDVLEVTLPWPMMGPVAPLMRVGASSGIMPPVDVLMPQPVPTTPPARPGLAVSHRAAAPGQLVAVQGTGWTPNSMAWLSLNHQRLVPFPVDALGNVMGTFIAPPLPPRDYFLDVVDDEGEMNMKVFRIAHFALKIMRASQNEVDISWSKEAVGFMLHSADSLTAPTWVPVPRPVVLQGDNYVVRDSVENGARYYRLVGN